MSAPVGNTYTLTHGHSVGGQRSPTYNSWRAMRERCERPAHPFYPLYGGRGITVCDRWKGAGGFERFLADLGERPEGMTLDRIDPDGSYEPANCRWATKRAQRWNRRDMASIREQLGFVLPLCDSTPDPERESCPF